MSPPTNMQDTENGQKRVWRIRQDARSIYEFDKFLDVGPFTTFEAAEEKRERMKRTPEFKDVKLSIIPDPPTPHWQTNMDGI